MTTITFSSLEFEAHPNGEGSQAVQMFENGYGVSVICTPFSYGGNMKLFELAPIYRTGPEKHSFELEETGEAQNVLIADGEVNGVAGWLTPALVTKFMLKLQRLEAHS